MQIERGVLINRGGYNKQALYVYFYSIE